jgi:chromosome partitioning protein
MNHKIICVLSIKGGVGKTSLSIHLSLSLAKKKFRVLLVDCDHNNNSTDFFLRDVDVSQIEMKNIKRVFLEKNTLEESVWEINKGGTTIDVIPATPELWTIGQELITEPMALNRFISYVRMLDYDFILFDTPPARCFELHAALYAADLFLIPVSPNRWIIQNYNLITGEIKKVKQSTGRNPTTKVVPYMVSPTGREFVESVNIWDRVATSFPRDSAVQNSTDSGKPLKENTKSNQLFSSLADEIIVLNREA